MRRRRDGQGIAIDDQGDLAVGEDGAARQGGALADGRGQGARDELALADEQLAAERDVALAAADDDGVVLARRGRVADASPRSRIGRTRSPRTSMRRPATERIAWSSRRTVRCTRSSGIAKGRPPDCTSSADMIASVSGRRISAVVPAPCTEVSVASPPRPRMAERTASMPTPRPETSLIVSAVLKPAVKSSSAARGWSTEAISSALIRPRSQALRATRSGSIPRPSSRTEMTMLEPAWRAEISTVPVAGLPAATRSVGGLHAVVERVAHEVDDRVAEGVDDGAIELGVLAGEDELDLLAELRGEVADEAREAQEDGLDGDHADLHDHRLQRLRGAREVLHRG